MSTQIQVWPPVADKVAPSRRAAQRNARAEPPDFLGRALMVPAGGPVRDELDRLVPGDRDPGRLIWTSAGAGLFVLQPCPKDEAQVVWSSGVVKVSAVRSTHTVGHASYRVDTPAGSVVIGGDAGNDVPTPPRVHSTSDQVERLAKGVDIIVHSAFHPVMGPDRDSGMPPPIFHRQSLATDLPILARWRSGWERGTLCSLTLAHRLALRYTIAGRFLAVR